MIKDILVNNQDVKSNSCKMSVLREHFAGCFTPDGAFDMERFKEMLRDEVDLKSEGYSLNFLGKDYANLIASVDTTTVVVPDLEHNSKPENKDSENVYISGDNLDALKHLLKSYAGQVKCIYIDPPYNTGTDGFVYNDRFSFTSEQLQKRLSVDEEEANRILDMTSRGSSSHSAWLMFMSPRLQLARQLLSKDGVIFISIDDNEQANLKLLCDYVFGEENFVANVIWKHTQQSKNDERFFSRHYNEILIYARDINVLPNFRFERNESDNINYSNPDNDPKGKWRSGDVRSPNYRPTLCYNIIAPNGNVISSPANGWRWSEESVAEKIKSGEIIFKTDNSGIIRKIYLADQNGRMPENLWEGEGYGTTRQAANEIKELFNDIQVFDTPKPTSLIKKIISLCTSDDDIIVDFFSGSATTADAIMNYNVGNKGSNRKFLLVQWQEEFSEQSDAYKAGYRTIDQIGQERIKRAAKKIKAENPLFAGDLGFKHYTLKEVPENVLDKMEEFNPEEATFGGNMLELFGRETVLATWKVRDGYGLTSDVEEVQLADYTAYQCGDHLYLLDEGLSDDAITAMVDKYGEPTPWNPHNVVLFGYNMNFGVQDALKTNLPLLNEGEKQVKINIDVRY